MHLISGLNLSTFSVQHLAMPLVADVKSLLHNNIIRFLFLIEVFALLILEFPLQAFASNDMVLKRGERCCSFLLFPLFQIRGDKTSSFQCYIPLKTRTAIIQGVLVSLQEPFFKCLPTTLRSLLKSLLPRIVCPLIVSSSELTKMPSVSRGGLTISHEDIDVHPSKINSTGNKAYLNICTPSHLSMACWRSLYFCYAQNLVGDKKEIHLTLPQEFIVRIKEI